MVMGNQKLTMKQKATMRKCRMIGMGIFGAAMLLGCVVGFLFFFRPQTSNVEKRKLTEFPEFTLTSFLDGSFFSEVSLWYSDTYPMRDTLIAMDQKLKSVYGVTTSTMLVGGNAKGDDIPEEETGKETEVAAAETKAPETESKPIQIPDSKVTEEEIQNQIQQGLYVKDGAAYSIYYFNQDTCKIYTDALNGAAQKLKGTADVYSVLIPNNSGAMLPEDELSGLGGSDQQQAISYYYSKYEDVTPIRTIETLREHNDEYLYFRTDHHWTQLGAYYVYRNFCEAKKWTPHELTEFQTMKFSPFLGSFYAELGNADMAANPDEVTAYIPNGTNDMTYWNEDGTEQPWNVIRDVTGWGDNTGYYCFIGGDKPLSIIENPKIQDGSSCMVVKESYGNSFVPFLVDHYQTVYVVDFRYAQVNVVDYVKEKKIQDLIIMNNITIAAGENAAYTIAGIL